MHSFIKTIFLVVVSTAAVGFALPSPVPDWEAIDERSSLVQRDLNSTLTARSSGGWRACYGPCSSSDSNNCGPWQTITSGSAQCIHTTDRHYFQVAGDGCSMSVSAIHGGWQCVGGTTDMSGVAGAGGCYNVNTGRSWDWSWAQCA